MKSWFFFTKTVFLLMSFACLSTENWFLSYFGFPLEIVQKWRDMFSETQLEPKIANLKLQNRHECLFCITLSLF